jgi:RimJ/RimL family protein N-acetyltransferase
MSPRSSAQKRAGAGVSRTSTRARASGGAPEPSKLSIRALEPDDWTAIARLFGANGACGGCWCMWWRVEKGGKTWDEAKGEKNRARMAKLVKQGAVHAMIAFDRDEPIGWCSFGPHASFPRLLNSRVLRHEPSDDTWSIVCFFIPAKQRGKGLATRLLEAATRHAFALGARTIEGYPVVPQSSSERMPAAFAWTGVPAVFEAVGYERIARESELRPIYAVERGSSRGSGRKRKLR